MFAAKNVSISYLTRQIKGVTVRTFVLSRCNRIEEYKRFVVREAESIRELFHSEDFKPRKSPTNLHIPKVSLPDTFVRYTERILQHESLATLEEGANKLTQHLRYRKPPIEQDEYRAIAGRVEDEIKEKDSFIEPFLSAEQSNSLETSRHNKIRKQLKRIIYHWEPINYDHTTALHYLLSRTAAEYAVLVKVFHEITKRDPKFTPSTMLDFGSGIGSVLWAAQKFWSSTLVESVCVDTSREMNDIAELIIRKGFASRQPMFRGVYFRQFLASGTDRKYDLVVSSYSLMELPSAQARLETLDNLWKKTRKYLVLLEPGSNAGFELINEARDFLLQTYKDQDGVNYKVKISEGHVFAPCPNDTICPRYSTDTTPCNFNVKYRPLVEFKKDLTQTEVFCYLVLKKGPRSGSDEQWPRLVRDPLLRGKHIICRVCTKGGDLREAVLTKKKHIRPLYACARKSECGDILPVVEVEPEADEEDSGEEEDLSEDEIFEEGRQVKELRDSKREDAEPKSERMMYP